MPTIIRGCEPLDRSGDRRTTRMASSSVKQVAGSAAAAAAAGSSGARRGFLSPVMRHTALAVGLLLAACAAPSVVGSSPYHAPNDVDIGHAGGGGGGGM